MDRVEAARHGLLDHRRVLLGQLVELAHGGADLAQGARLFLDRSGHLADEFIDGGYLDTFRMFNQEGGNYTWWSMITRGRERNVGWRLDYHCVNEATAKHVRAAEIHADVMGSDHCPVSVTLEI